MTATETTEQVVLASGDQVLPGPGCVMLQGLSSKLSGAPVSHQDGQGAGHWPSGCHPLTERILGHLQGLLRLYHRDQPRCQGPPGL